MALRVADLSFNAESGDAAALIRNTKAGREESRYLSINAVKYLTAWMDFAETKEGAVFRRSTPRGTIGQAAIAPQEAAWIVQRIGRAVNAKGVYGAMAWPASHISAHSTRRRV